MEVKFIKKINFFLIFYLTKIKNINTVSIVFFKAPYLKRFRFLMILSEEVTLKDIAAHLRLSVPRVSRALGGIPILH